MEAEERSAENPAVPLSSIADGDEMYDALAGGGKTASGVRVTRDKALGYSAVWRGVNLIAGALGRHAFRVYRYNGPGLKLAEGHPADHVLRKPNGYMTAFTFRQTLQAHALLDGNGYAYVSRDPAAKPLELLTLNPDTTWPVRVNGVLWYVTESDEPLPGKKRKGDRQLIKIPAADMLHVKGLGFDGLCGYPVVKILRETIGGVLARRDYGSRYFKNNARPGVALEVPASMKESAVANLRESWERLHAGIDNAHRVAILRDGVKLHVYESNARDAQFSESRAFDVREVANLLGIPPHKLGDDARTAYNSLESENQAYYDDTLDPWFVGWEQEADSKLLTEEEKARESHTCQFDRRPMSRMSLESLGKYFSTAILSGWHCPDEVRAKLNENPRGDGFGGVFLRPGNTVVAGEEAKPEPEPVQPPGDGGDRAAVRALAADTIARCVRRVANEAARHDTPARLASFLDGKMWDEVPRLAEMLAAVASASRAAGRPDDLARSLCQDVRSALAPLAKRAGVSGDEITKAAGAAGIPERAAALLFPEK